MLPENIQKPKGEPSHKVGTANSRFNLFAKDYSTFKDYDLVAVTEILRRRLQKENEAGIESITIHLFCPVKNTLLLPKSRNL